MDSNVNEELITNNTKRLPKEYIMLEIRLSINKELYESNIISFEVFRKFQDLTIKKMNKIAYEVLNKEEEEIVAVTS